MNFQTLQHVETADKYIDIAFHGAKESASEVRSTIGGRGKTRLLKSKTIEIQRITKVNRALHKSLGLVIESFPSFDSLDDFYEALVKATLDYDRIKKCLGAINWAMDQTNRLAGAHVVRIRKQHEVWEINPIRTAFYGRVASVIKQINPELMYLEECRKIMRRYPAIKTSMPTVVIAGYPNVGKTTLLRAITGSEPKIAPYPFTTQELMLGYHKDELSGVELQVIDTPGLLDRPLEERNKIELQAVLALEYLAKVMIFLIDPTESCGFSLDAQKNLLKSVREQFTMPVLVVLNKVDLDAEAIERAKKFFKNESLYEISADKNIGVKELVDDVVRMVL